jgi:hypothetical protein
MRVAAAAAVLALTCQLAHADSPGMTPSGPPGLTPVSPVAPVEAPPPTPLVASYRAQTLAADAAAVGLFLIAAKSGDRDRSEVFGTLSIATYALGAPFIHVTKNRIGRAVLSLTMRVGFPVIGGMLLDSLRPTSTCDDGLYCEYTGPSDEMVLGVIGGLIAASIVDAAVLAKGDAPKADRGWAPTARATQGGFAVGVHAAF